MATQQQAPIQITNLQFLKATRPKRLTVSTAVNYNDGGTSRYQMPQSGIADKIMLYITATIVVGGTVSAGTFNGFGQLGSTQAPWSIIKNFQFYSNNNLVIRNLGGWSMYKHTRYRYAQDPMKCTAVNYSTNTLAALGLNQGSGAIVAGANIAAGTYTWNVAIPIDLAYNQTAEGSLLSFQNGNIIYTAQITWGQVSVASTSGPVSNDLVNGLTGTGVTVTATIQASLGLDNWDYPILPAPYTMTSLLGKFLSVSDGIKTPLNNGLNTFNPPQNDYYTMIGTEWINNGAPIAVANLQNPTWQYAGNVFPFVENYGPLLVRDYYEHQIPSIDGNVFYDLGLRRGERLRRDTIDAFQDQNITNLQLNLNIGSALSITGVNQMNYLLENENNFSQPSAT